MRPDVNGTFLIPQQSHGVVNGWDRMVAAEKLLSAFYVGMRVMLTVNFNE